MTPKLNSSLSRVCMSLRTDLQIVAAAGVRDVGFDAPVGQGAVLRDGGGRVAERIAARIVVHAIAANERIDGQHGFGAEGVLIARSEVERDGLLPLVLVQLVVGVGNLEPVPRPEEIQVERILARGLVVEAVEDRAVVADGMDRRELRRVEEPAGSHRVDGEEIADLRTAERQRRLLRVGAERTPLTQQAAVGLLAEPRPGDGIDDQAGLVAEFGRGAPVISSID